METDRRPSPAECARTLALGVVPGAIHLLPEHEIGTTTLRVQHLCDARGALALLVPDAGDLGTRLVALTAAAADSPVVLDVLDVPPGQLCLPRARLCVTGWVASVSAARQRGLAQAIAAARPEPRLLDVGSGWSLYPFESAEIRVTTAAGTTVLGDADFANAEADPLYDEEDAIVSHLEACHRDETIAYALRELPPDDACRLSSVSVAGLDRYGVDLLCGIGPSYRTLRACFSRRVYDDDSLSQEMRRLFTEPLLAPAPQAS